jgi:hypothetical protein
VVSVEAAEAAVGEEAVAVAVTMGEEEEAALL